MRLKHVPSDFIVEEILPENLVQQEGPFFLLSFTKEWRNTEDVLQDVGRALGIPRKFLNICGNKDRHAQTTQFLSINRQPLREMREETLLGKLAGIRQARFSCAGYLDGPLSLGTLAGNRFKVTARDLDKEQADSAERMVAEGLPPIPNYFDEQRFSEHNLDVGRCLVKKDFVGALHILSPHETTNPIGELRKLPQKTLLLYVHAYQSWLWNGTVRQALDDLPGRSVPYAHGILFFPRHVVSQEKFPLVGFMTDLTALDKPLRAIIEGLLEKEGISPRDFVIRQIPEITSEGGMRDLFIDVKDYSIHVEEDEAFPGRKKAVLAFTLPPGSYATVVVKALFC